MLKTATLSFRIPRTLRKAVEWAAEFEDVSQSDFYIGAVTKFLEVVDSGTSIRDLQLPRGYQLPIGGVKMVAIRVAPKIAPIIKARAPRLCCTQTKLISWAATIRVMANFKRYNQQQQDKARISWADFESG